MAMDAGNPQVARRLLPVFRGLAAWGPGLLVMLADTDAGNVVTAAQAGAQWGYRLLPLIFALAPALYLVQELAARLGLFTGRGFGELIRERFGKTWARLALAGLAAATFGTLVTEFTGVAGIGDLYGVPRDVSLSLACAALLVVAATGSYRRIERIGLILGLFEGAFLYVAWQARPNLVSVARDAFHAPIGDGNFLFLAAAIVGSVFNPWMVFYQQSATARKNMRPDAYTVARWDTALGAALTQALTGAVLVAAAATLYAGAKVTSLTSIGQVGEALTAALGQETGRLIFSLGVLGASLAAALVASLALSWGVAEILGPQRRAKSRTHPRLFDSPWFVGLFGASVIGSATLARFSDDLVELNIAAQVANALLFPLIVGFLVILASKTLVGPHRLHGAWLLATVVVATTVAAIGFAGVVAGLR